MRRIIVTVGGLTVASWFGGCAPGYYDTRPRPVYVQPYAVPQDEYRPSYGYRERERERGERHEEHEEHEEHEHHDRD
jgi:hypothetical protein